MKCVRKYTWNKGKRQGTGYESILRHVSHEGLISMVNEEILQINNREDKKRPRRKMDKISVDKTNNKLKFSLVIRKMPVKAIRYHFIPSY